MKGKAASANLHTHRKATAESRFSHMESENPASQRRILCPLLLASTPFERFAAESRITKNVIQRHQRQRCICSPLALIRQRLARAHAPSNPIPHPGRLREPALRCALKGDSASRDQTSKRQCGLGGAQEPISWYATLAWALISAVSKSHVLCTSLFCCVQRAVLNADAVKTSHERRTLRAPRLS